MLKNKGTVEHLREMLLAIAIGLVIAIILFLPKIIIAKDTLFDLLGIKEKCKETGKTLNDYNSELTDFFENTPILKDNPERVKEITQKCKEFQLCFPREYPSFKEKCNSIQPAIPSKPKVG